MNDWKKTLVLVALLLLVAGPWLQQGGQATWSSQRLDVQPPVETVLTWDGRPGLHRTVTLAVEVTPRTQADDMTLHWVLPAGVTLSGSTSESLGPVVAGQTITRQRDLTFDQTGTFKVAVRAQVEKQAPPVIFGDADVLFFTIRRGLGSGVSRQGPGIKSTKERILTPHVQVSEPSGPQQAYVVSGRFLYEDIPVDTSGELPPIIVPARQVRVEVWEDDLLFDDRDCTTRTDDNGFFSCTVSDNRDIWGDKETYVRIYADTPATHVTDISWIDRDYYCFTENRAGGQNIDFGSMTPTDFDPMFNIADVLLDARDYASQFRSPPARVRSRYEPGREDGSYYTGWLDRITIAGESGDPDGYDDTVIIHEYGHFFADEYACNSSEGGEHFIDRHYSNELAWSEGWANYFSSAVRGDSWYLDWDWNGGWSVDADWETWTDATGSDNEGAVAATLWDIHDNVDETHDRLSLDGDEIWDTFDNRMEQTFGGLGGACDIFIFWDEWNAAGYPDDSELAAIFAHHDTAGVTGARAGQSESRTRAVSVQPLAAQVVKAGPVYGPDGRAIGPNSAWPNVASPNVVMRGGVPWNATLFLVDATSSMAGEIDEVILIMQNQVSDMDAQPFPYEYVVETFQDNGTNVAIVDHFFPDVVNPPIGNITVGGGGDAEEDTLAALARGTVDRFGYDAWLLTDAAPKYDISQMELEGLLQSREITPYFFVFGDCTEGNPAGTAATREALPRPAPINWRHLPRFSPAALEDCIEPYLLVASGTNGQFLLIDVGQEDDAAEIVRAFMSNNAGAGRYADYVSTSYAYIWDDTTFSWYDASGGTSWNVGDIESPAVSLPQPFPFYGNSYSSFDLTGRGYVSFSSLSSVDPSNTDIPTTALPNNAIYAFWDDISTYQLPLSEAPEQIPVIYTEYDAANNRFVIEYSEAYHVGTLDYETFEILLDYDTNEIILQYNLVTNDSSCTVGVENAAGTAGTQVIYNNPGSLYAGRAIQFTPMPPNSPTDHEVVVDSLMDGVIFLLNGYSGIVDLTVYDPSMTPVDPADPDVTFLDLGKVKYYRVNNPDVGTWIARVSGNGTYYFTSSSASALEADLESDPTLSSLINNLLLVNLGMSLTVQPNFSLVFPDGSLFDTPNLYDDGAHGDGEADDGVYGGVYNAPDNGTFYMQVDGQTPAGEDFRRTALTPIRFQGMELVPPTPSELYALPGQTLVYSFTLYNDTPEIRLFSVELQSNRGWSTTPAVVYLINPYSSAQVPVTVAVPGYAPNTVEQSVLTAFGVGMTDNAVVATTVRGWVTYIDLLANPDQMPTGGHQAVIAAQVEDDIGWSVADGTEVTFQTTLGTVDPLTGTTVNGLVTTTLTSGATAGIAQVQASADGVTRMITVGIYLPQAYTLTLTAADSQLPANGISTTLLTVNVYDDYGDPAPDGSTVVIGVEGDEMFMGSVEGQEVYTTTTSGGVATATYRSGTAVGRAYVRAEIILGGSSGDGEATEDRRWARTSILLTNGAYNIYLPIVYKGAQ